MKNTNEDRIIKVLDKDKPTKEVVTGRIRGWKRSDQINTKVFTQEADKVSKS